MEIRVPDRCDGVVADDAPAHDYDYSHPIRLDHFGCGDNGQVQGDRLDSIPERKKNNIYNSMSVCGGRDLNVE